MMQYKNVTLAKPLLSDSQIKFRLGLARQRTRAYPLDSLDFIMIDLERPQSEHRQAFQCAGDLTGRLLEFLSHADGVDGSPEPVAGVVPSGLSRFVSVRCGSCSFVAVRDGS